MRTLVEARDIEHLDILKREYMNNFGMIGEISGLNGVLAKA